MKSVLKYILLLSITSLFVQGCSSINSSKTNNQISYVDNNPSYNVRMEVFNVDPITKQQGEKVYSHQYKTISGDNIDDDSDYKYQVINFGRSEYEAETTASEKIITLSHSPETSINTNVVIKTDEDEFNVSLSSNLTIFNNLVIGNFNGKDMSISSPNIFSKMIYGRKIKTLPYSEKLQFDNYLLTITIDKI